MSALRAAEGDTGATRYGGSQQGYYSMTCDGDRETD